VLEVQLGSTEHGFMLTKYLPRRGGSMHDKTGETALFSIIIVNMNAAGFLEKCLQSIVAIKGDIPVEIILVDNGSSDRSLEVARTIDAGVKLIPQGRNIGYVRAQ
jgi:hypothetical protein